MADEWPHYLPAVLVGLMLAAMVAIVLWDLVREWRGPKP